MPQFVKDIYMVDIDELNVEDMKNSFSKNLDKKYATDYLFL